MGRVISYHENIEDGKLLTGSTVEGYTVLNIKPADTYQSLYLHREVAKLFAQKAGRGQKYVIHLDFDKKNNKVSNLRWASKEEMEKHQQKRPGQAGLQGKAAQPPERAEAERGQSEKHQAPAGKTR